MRRLGGRVVVTSAALIATVLAPAAGAQEPPPPPAPPLPVIPPTVCLDHEPETASDYNAVLAGTVGMWPAGDVPHRYPLPDGRVLWLLNDSFLSPTDPAGALTADSGFVHNVAFDYAPAAADPSLYRPTFGDVQLPRVLLRHRIRAAASPGPRVLAI
jgi:hypothetical protein